MLFVFRKYNTFKCNCPHYITTLQLFYIKKFVFKNNKKDEKNLAGEYISYLGLAAFIFAMNTLLLQGMVEALNINAFLAKIITEVVLFALSYFVQRHLVFVKKNENVEENNYAASLK